MKEFAQEFKKEFGATLRIYNGRSEADSEATLVSLGAKTGIVECRASRTVGSFVEMMQKDFDLKVKVRTTDDWVTVIDGLTLNRINDLPKNPTKTQMEDFVSYQRENKPLQQEKMKKINILMEGSGYRVDILDKDGNLLNCYAALREDGIEYVKIEGDRNYYDPEDLGTVYRWDDYPDEYEEGTEEYEEAKNATAYNYDTHCYYLEDKYSDSDKKGSLKNVEEIQLVFTAVSGEAEIEIPEHEKFDIKKLHLLESEFVLPDCELEVYMGLAYQGKQFDIDIEEFRTKGMDEIWNRKNDKE